MRKMKLTLDALAVESFDTCTDAEKRAGTVRANEAEYCPQCCCCPCQCTCCHTCAPCYPQTATCQGMYTCGGEDTCQYNTCDPALCWYQLTEYESCQTGWCAC